ncbi:FAD/NAD(P)-binding domain-containing protein [Trametopsis cervina]|nr:FAD/NAD(P)-binding domain-containing protein [Trametopsis cervina]
MASPVHSGIARLTLDFVVVGGGLAGLSVAHMLCQAGHRVRVLERQPSLSSSGPRAGGLRVPPNMSKILKRWVGEEAIRKSAVRCLESPWWDLHTGESYGYAPWRLDVMTETGGDFFLMAYHDVHELIYGAAVESGAQIDFGVTVTEVIPGNPKPSVKLSTGEIVTGDIIIGADGPRSMVREVVVGEEDQPRPSGITALSGIVPASELAKDPELYELVTAEKWPMMMGHNRSLCRESNRSHSELMLLIHWPDEEVGTPEDAAESWFDKVPTESLNLEGIIPLYQRLIKMAPCLWRSRNMERDEIEDWIDESGRIVLIGEGAHPWVQGLTHGPSMCLEDAVVFGKLFSHLSSWEQIPTFLSAYEQIRMARIPGVRERDDGNAMIVRLPPGPIRDARNAGLQVPRQEWDEGTVKTEFEGVAMLFAYDAYDAAEEWWIQWGRYLERTPADDKPIHGDTMLSLAATNVTVAYV